MITLNSDDPAMFLSDLQDGYRLAHEALALPRSILRELAANSIEPVSFPRRERSLSCIKLSR